MNGPMPLMAWETSFSEAFAVPRILKSMLFERSLTRLSSSFFLASLLTGLAAGWPHRRPSSWPLPWLSCQPQPSPSSQRPSSWLRLLPWPFYQPQPSPSFQQPWLLSRQGQQRRQRLLPWLSCQPQPSPSSQQPLQLFLRQPLPSWPQRRPSSWLQLLPWPSCQPRLSPSSQRPWLPSRQQRLRQQQRLLPQQPLQQLLLRPSWRLPLLRRPWPRLRPWPWLLLRPSGPPRRPFACAPMMSRACLTHSSRRIRPL